MSSLAVTKEKMQTSEKIPLLEKHNVMTNGRVSVRKDTRHEWVTWIDSEWVPISGLDPVTLEYVLDQVESSTSFSLEVCNYAHGLTLK